MRAVTVSTAESGDVVALGWGTAPDPHPGPGDVLIDVAAAGVNRADLMQARGRYPVPPGASEILGLECSGIVIASAPDVIDGYPVGSEVCALLTGGGYAEQVAVPAAQVLPVPAGVSLVDAAALPEAACTVWSNLVMTAQLSRGERLLVHGGSSGIGTMAIQVAKSLGAEVIATAGSPDKLAACTALGADTAIDYRTDDFVEGVMDATAGHGADVILDLVGASYLARNIAALADGGRLVVIGLLGGARAELDLTALMAKRASVTGTLLRTRAPGDGRGSKAAVVEQVRAHLWPMIRSGSVRPVIGARLPMPDAGEAHRLLYDGDVIGKVVLTAPGSARGSQTDGTNEGATTHE